MTLFINNPLPFINRVIGIAFGGGAVKQVHFKVGAEGLVVFVTFNQIGVVDKRAAESCEVAQAAFNVGFCRLFIVTACQDDGIFKGIAQHLFNGDGYCRCAHTFMVDMVNVCDADFIQLLCK